MHLLNLSTIKTDVRFLEVALFLETDVAWCCTKVLCPLARSSDGAYIESESERRDGEGREKREERGETRHEKQRGRASARSEKWLPTRAGVLIRNSETARAGGTK